MIKKLLFTIIAVSSLITGCGKNAPTNRLEQNEKPALADSANNGTATKSPEKNLPATPKSPEKSIPTTTPASRDKTIDYKQYLKKTWNRNTDTKSPNDGRLSILISTIKDGKIQGKLSAVDNGPAYNMDNAEFEGTIKNDTAECQIVNDSRGNKGSVEILFKPDTIEATITLTEKSGDTVMRLPEGTFEFIPYNLKDINGFESIDNQTFMVDLDSWGDVKFVSGKLTAGDHIPVVFYLANKNGDILYDFNPALPYSVDVSAVSFKDVNKDGQKDVIIIVSDNYDGSSGVSIATVYLQNADGSFTNDTALDQEINNSGNNKDIGAITNYLSNKF